ncbi:hypothetical protein [Methanofollis formosanus]|uniref:hypothetical protein n=1 Tax=Methanofollis formosanus TaxID=299308 RepID=UPI001C7D3D61|nr:hypothetical protein [Methanofollis formosanus]
MRGGRGDQHLCRAREREPDRVYCVSLDDVARNDENVNPRNRLAVGMTPTWTGAEERAISYQQERV